MKAVKERWGQRWRVAGRAFVAAGERLTDSAARVGDTGPAGSLLPVKLPARPAHLGPVLCMRRPAFQEVRMVDDARVQDVAPEREAKDVARKRNDVFGRGRRGRSGVERGERDVEREEGRVGRLAVVGEGRERVSWEEEGREEKVVNECRSSSFSLQTSGNFFSSSSGSQAGPKQQTHPAGRRRSGPSSGPGSSCTSSAGRAGSAPWPSAGGGLAGTRTLSADGRGGPKPSGMPFPGTVGEGEGGGRRRRRSMALAERGRGRESRSKSSPRLWGKTPEDDLRLVKSYA